MPEAYVISARKHFVSAMPLNLREKLKSVPANGIRRLESLTRASHPISMPETTMPSWDRLPHLRDRQICLGFFSFFLSLATSREKDSITLKPGVPAPNPFQNGRLRLF